MPELLKGFGGEVLVADDQPDLLEGGGPVGFVVVFRFPHPGDLRYPTVTIAMWSPSHCRRRRRPRDRQPRRFPGLFASGWPSSASPDNFVLSLSEADVEAVPAVVETQAASLRRPPMTTLELLDGLAVVDLTSPADAIRQRLR